MKRSKFKNLHLNWFSRENFWAYKNEKKNKKTNKYNNIIKYANMLTKCIFEKK